MSNKIAPIRSVKGTRDLLPPETGLWQRVEDESRRVFAAYNFQEIRTPILEATALFARSVGADTDIVMKEMFTFEDREPEFDISKYDDDPEVAKVLAAFSDRRFPFRTSDGLSRDSGLPNVQVMETMSRHPEIFRKSLQPNKRGQDLWTLRSTATSLTLRPEATASVVRAYIEHSLFNEGRQHKLYYIGPMFRRERPQKGRYRQFYQIGAEVLGSDHPSIDAEMLEMLVLLLERLGLAGFSLLLNSVGCSKCRPEYVKILRQALQSVKASMCADCQRRAETNPLRVLDCKVEPDQPIIEKLPHIVDHLDPECRQHFNAVTADLDERGVAYTLSPRLVRGLDYYTRTTFEITSSVLGAQNAILGGGRYDGLSEMLGGPPTPGFGVAIGEDRLVLAVAEAAKDKMGPAPAQLDAYIAWMGDAALAPATALARQLRRDGLRVEIGYEPAKLKKSLGLASRLGARFAVIIGEGELATGRYQVKDMAAGTQQEVEAAKIGDDLKAALAK